MKKTKKNKALKVRKSWDICPIQKPHSTKKGKKGYKRSDSKKAERDHSE